MASAGELALLNMALVNFGLSFLYARGYTPVQTPFFMKKSVMRQCAQLEQFDEELYHVTGTERRRRWWWWWRWRC
jgi:seryl-tRNA synthetase